MKSKINITAIAALLKNNRTHYNIVVKKKELNADNNTGKKSSIFAQQTTIEFSEN